MSNEIEKKDQKQTNQEHYGNRVRRGVVSTNEIMPKLVFFLMMSIKKGELK